MSTPSLHRQLVVPAAAVLAFGLVAVPPAPGSATAVPRLTEVAAVRLQAEASSLVAGLEWVTPAPAAVSSPAVPAAAASEPCYYPCTFLDKFIDGLPTKVSELLIYPLYAVAWVVGLVMAPVLLVTSAAFGWPYSLWPAAAAAETPETSASAPAEAALAGSGPTPTTADPGISLPVPGEPADDAAAAVEIPAGAGVRGPRVRVRGVTPTEASPATPVEADHVEVTPAGADTLEVAPAEAKPVDVTPAADVALEEEAAPAADRPKRTRGRSSETRSGRSAAASSSSR